MEILPGPEVFYTLAGRIMPRSDPDQWVEELEDLFRILFRGCTRIEITPLRGRRGEIVTVWVQPCSEFVPLEHPLLVKCGTREKVEQARASFQNYLFRVTAIRESCFATTRHFAAIALPAPTDRPWLVYDFPSFYRSKANAGAESDIHLVIDRLFGEALRPWYRHTRAPLALQKHDLRLLYLTRLGLNDKEKNREHVQEVIEHASAYGVSIEQKNHEIGFQFSRKSNLYPDPILHLHGDTRSVKIFGVKPSNLCLTHGNIREMNFSVDDRMFVWLDGYESVEWGSPTADMAGLEVILKFHCMESLGLHELYEFEREVLSPTHFDELRSRNISSLPQDIQQISNTIDYVRINWAKRMANGDMEEYYANLFFFTMRELISEETPSAYRSYPEIRKLHALLSAAMLCHRLKNWDNWSGWPNAKPRIWPMR